MEQHTLTRTSMARLMGLPDDQVPAACLDFMDGRDFRYHTTSGKERDALILRALERVEGDSQQVGATARQGVWEAGWQEVFDAFLKSGCKIESLRPQYYQRGGQPLRYDGDYILPVDPLLEYHVFCVLRRWVFEAYLRPYEQVHEFGCGTGHNLADLAGLFPDKQLHGTDFVRPPLQILERLREDHGMNVRGGLFNMVEPDPDYDLGPESAVYTFGALEQLAGRFQPVLDFWLHKRPALCLHLEPTFELYDPTDLLDWLAIRFHQKRGYTRGFLSALQALEKDGRAEILQVRRTRFGSQMMEGYSLIVWRPRG